MSNPFDTRRPASGEIIVYIERERADRPMNLTERLALEIIARREMALCTAETWANLERAGLIGPDRRITDLGIAALTSPALPHIQQESLEIEVRGEVTAYEPERGETYGCRGTPAEGGDPVIASARVGGDDYVLTPEEEATARDKIAAKASS